jgi:hypothetical protein
VHALRKVHSALKPGGELVDVHPVPPSTAALAGSAELGLFDDREFFEIVRSTEAGLEQLVAAGMYAFVDETEFDWLEQYDSGRELLEDVAEWDGLSVPDELRSRIEQGSPPLFIRERVVLRRYQSR